MPHVLITGAAGFIGSHLTERLLQSGFTVVGLDNLDAYYDPAIKRENLRTANAAERFQLIEGDIRDRELVESITAQHDFEAIIHLAARAGVRPSVVDPELYVDVNVNGTARLLAAAHRHNVRKFVFASSSSVYGSRTNGPFHEDDNVDAPVSPYAATKKAGELLCYAHHHLTQSAVTCLRFFTVYGPRQRPEMAIHKFVRLIDAEEEIEVYGDGSSQRDFTYVDDIIDGIVSTLQRPSGYRIYNLGNHRTTSIVELVKHIESALGKDARIAWRAPQAGDVPLTCADIQRAQAELTYQPSFPLEKGIARFVKWFRTQKQ